KMEYKKMTNNQISKCCGSEVKYRNEPVYMCSNCMKQCSLVPVEPTNENPYPTGDLSPVQPTETETRSTEGWEKFEKLREFLADKENSDIEGYIYGESALRVLKFIEEEFVTPRLAAQREEMEREFIFSKKNQHYMHIPSNIITMEEHNKQIIEAVEEFKNIVRNDLEWSDEADRLEEKFVEFKKSRGFGEK
ncbi:MAG: hypothetical protein NUV78_03135, partial [Candidatus Zambryskibacteria bacterium]|nr:hypothetical protein [Candidatus Zambryskibacteria bacterium]